jgi:hypothetical protein
VQGEAGPVLLNWPGAGKLGRVLLAAPRFFLLFGRCVMSLIGFKFAAIAVAYRAQCGDVDPLDVDHLLVEADTRLHRDHRIFRAVSRFATQYQLAEHDRRALRQLGCELAAQVEGWPISEPADA